MSQASTPSATDGVSPQSGQTGKGLRPRGVSIVAGRDASIENSGPSGGRRFAAIDPSSGRATGNLGGGGGVFSFVCAHPSDVDDACVQAWEAFHDFQDRPAAARADLLDAIAAGIDALGEDLLGITSDETGLGPARLVSERERTTNQLRMFATILRKGDWVEAIIDTAQPSRRPVPKPDLRRMLRPLGPVAVFGAGNFPLAYSTAGGDTTSALAAGCPVIVKGHPGHPATGELVARVIARCVAEMKFHPGTFSFLHAGGEGEFAVGERLVKHPCVRAVGFTGSVRGGLELARLASPPNRHDPIPVFAEMGSVNPVFILPDAAKEQAEAIGERLAGSIMNSNGQMCTCPGLLFGVRSPGTETLVMSMAKALNQAPPQTMLSARTRFNFAKRCHSVATTQGVEIRGGSPQAPHRNPDNAVEPDQPIRASASLFKVAFKVFRETPDLHEEIFGPAAIFIDCENESELAQAASLIQGTLTATIWAGALDGPIARELTSILEHRAGRIIYNGVPTGVEVSDAMVHGGPFPATNQPHTTAVGASALRRWCRPVAYQNAPDAVLPQALRSANPLNIERQVNGERTTAKVASVTAGR